MLVIVKTLGGWPSNHESSDYVKKKKSFSFQIALMLLIVVEY